jgi:hypothetical protein
VNSSTDKTWDMIIQVRVTTVSGWEPDREDIEGWLERGDSLELLSVESVQEAMTSDQLDKLSQKIGLQVGESKTVAWNGRNWIMTRTQ